MTSEHPNTMLTSVIEIIEEGLTVIIAPLLDPVTKTFDASALYCVKVHLTMFAIVLLSPSPS